MARPLYTELVLVCCHAVYTGDGVNVTEDEWLLQPFQQSSPSTGKPSEHETMIAHIVTAAMTVESRPNALLIFSGGRTTIAQRTEAEGYEKIFLALTHFYPRARERYLLENHATDSYQNLLFSVLRFHSFTGHSPAQIIVITHAFKEARFLELHAPAIKWPAARLRVQGINPPFTREELRQTQLGEESRGYRPFVEDPYGAHAPLADKRLARGWKVETLDEVTRDVVDPALRALLNWTGGESGKEIFPGALAWQEEDAP